MSKSERKLILASSSPRRRDLLQQAGYEFVVVVPEIEETSEVDEPPESCATRLALQKAQAVAGQIDGNACVLAADTLVVLSGKVFGKPRNEEEARHMLRSLAGRTHRVLTGFALVLPDSNHTEIDLEESHVSMRNISEREAHAYALSGEPLDKAGAYAAQGEGARFIVQIDGSRSNVIGLPLEPLIPRLARLGIHSRCPS